MSNVILIKTEEQLKKIISENENVAVDFFAEWCGPCKMLLPVLDQISTENNNVVICKVNVDDNGSIAEENSVRSIPTVIFYKNGEKVGSNTGYVPKAQFIQILGDNLNFN